MLEALLTLLQMVTAFVLVLSVVVFVHEFGHFQAARWCKVAVEAFSIGFGKSLFSWTDKSGVVWKVGQLPLGGYVKFKGDADAVSSKPADTPAGEVVDQAAARAAGLFHAQPVGVRAFVVAAGPLANFIFSTLVFAALFVTLGKDVTDRDALSARIDQIRAESPAAAAGIQPGDIVLEIDGQPIANFGAMSKAIEVSGGKPLSLKLDRQGQQLSLTATPDTIEAMDEAGARYKRGLLGIVRVTQPDERVIQRMDPFSAVFAGAGEVIRVITQTIAYIGNIFSGKASPEHLAGPLGIADQSGKVMSGAWSAAPAGEPPPSVLDRIGNTALSLIQWAAILSIAVGFVNLLPIPVLDGGHLAFYGVEAARGRPLSPQAQEMGFRAGFAVIMALFLFSTWNDLQRLNILEFLSGMLS
jgi:regulator of sigma E protease